ncbi:MAG: UbiA family prenyltransferase [Algisphaera sp.]
MIPNAPNANPLKAWLELARISNLPTVWSNIVMGMAWGMACHMRELDINPASVTSPNLSALLNQAFMLLIAGSVIYTAGMFLNDALDHPIDQTQRPTRPIPSGRICPKQAKAWSAVLLLAGITASAVYTPSPWVLPLVASLALCVVLYNLLHNRWPGSVLLMATCRALLVFAATMAPWSSHTTTLGPRLIPAAILFGWTLLIAAVARQEVQRRRIPWVITLIIAMPLIDAALCLQANHPQAALFCISCAALTATAQWFVKGS